MQYSFKSLTQHNFKSIFIRHLPRLFFTLAFIGAVQFFFPQSNIAKSNTHIYIALISEVIALFFLLNDNSINEIIIDTVKREVRFFYYNLHQGQMEKAYSFTILKVNIETGKKDAVTKIDFYTKKLLGFTLKKDKDKFSHQDINTIKDLLYSITSPKSV